MADGADDPSVHWVEPRMRAILPLDGFRLSRSLKKVIVADRFRVTTDECWLDGELAGGLYGVSLGRAFFGESMVSRARDASKVALAHLVARLRAGGWLLLDCQFITPHLASLGAIEIPQADYLARLYSVLSGAEGAAGGGAAASGAPPSPPFVAGDWGALDALADEDVVLEAGRATGSPPGYVIAQLLT